MRPDIHLALAVFANNASKNPNEDDWEIEKTVTILSRYAEW
jgi:hypothetical protein